MEMKTCTKCGETLPTTLEYFHKSGTGLRTICKLCIKAYKEQWYKKNESEILRKRREYYYSDHQRSLERSKEYRHKNKSKLRVRELEGNHNIKEKHIRDLMDKQRGCCAICGDSLVNPDSYRSFSVDHNHETGNVRGLLCHSCNTSLGLLKENPSILFSMIKYIEEFRDV